MCLIKCLGSLFRTNTTENKLTVIDSDGSDNDSSSPSTPRTKLEHSVTNLFSDVICNASQVGVAGCVTYFSKKLYDSYNNLDSLAGLWNAAIHGPNPYVKCQISSLFSAEAKRSTYEKGQMTGAVQALAAAGCGLTSLFYLTCAAKDVICCSPKAKIGTVTKLTASAAYAASAIMLADCAIKNIANCS